MRILGFVLLVAALFARPVLACGGPAMPTQETISPSESPTKFTIEFRGEPGRHAILVEPWPQGFVRLTSAKKERTFVPSLEIRAIRDDQGRDRTKEMLVDRETLAQLPVEPSAPAAELPRVITTPISSFVVRKDSILVASRVERIGSEKLVVTRVDGVSQPLPVYRVRWIRSLDGQDHTNSALHRGKVVKDVPILVGYPATRVNFRKLRGQPMPYRSVFPLIQGGLLGFLGGDGDGYERGATAVGELGAMKNLGTRYAFGISGFLAADGRYQRVGIKSRARLWLGRNCALDFAPGIMGADDSDPQWTTYAPGFTAEAALSIADLAVLSTSVESFRESVDYGPGQRYEQTTTSWHLGIKLGGELAIPGMIAAVGLRPRGSYAVKTAHP